MKFEKHSNSATFISMPPTLQANLILPKFINITQINKAKHNSVYIQKQNHWLVGAHLLSQGSLDRPVKCGILISSYVQFYLLGLQALTNVKRSPVSVGYLQ